MTYTSERITSAENTKTAYLKDIERLMGKIAHLRMRVREVDLFLGWIRKGVLDNDLP